MPASYRPARHLPLLGILSIALTAPAATAAAPADPSIASPRSYEQITRADGGRGATALKTLETPQPVFASDLGLSAAYVNGPSFLQLQPPPASTVVRNTLTNRSQNLGSSAGQLISADRLEQTGLFRATVPGTEGEPAKTFFRIARLDGRGTPRDLPISSSYAQVALSGNGRFVISSDELGLRRLNIATGQWTQLAQVGLIGRTSVSDDGQTVAAIDFNFETLQVSAVIYRGAERSVLVENYPFSGDGEPLLSRDGRTAFTLTRGGEYPEPSTLTVHQLATGQTKTTTLPFEKVYDARPLWVDPQGDKIAFALGTQDRDGVLEPAKVFDTKTGAWSTFGGPFSTSLTSAPQSFSGGPTAISRNGRYAALAFNDQVALVNLTGGPLVGNILGREALSASSYLDSPGLDYCGFGFSSSFVGVFTRPAAWVNAPRRAKITVSNGTQVLADETWTTPARYPGASDDGQDSLITQFPLGTPHTRTVTFDVTDGDGRRLSETYSETVTCGALPQ
ncbi:MAG: hypothetical protein JHD16_17675 [Solirubrobacteraceae bacterium]|nr:hypothetical protein [Solirubrobacteraceae bacterium]